MRYFTKDWYNEGQVYGFLSFPSTMEEWEADIAWYTEQGIDYERVFAEQLALRRDDLLRYLPQSFHPYIEDGTLKTTFPSEALRTMAAAWCAQVEQKRLAVRQAYAAQFAQEKLRLQRDSRQLAEMVLHDATIVAMAHEQHMLTLTLQSGLQPSALMQLTFSGVSEVDVPHALNGVTWLYDELYATVDGFELHVLVGYPLHELRVRAKHVHIAECE